MSQEVNQMQGQKENWESGRFLRFSSRKKEVSLLPLEKGASGDQIDFNQIALRVSPFT